MPELVRDSGDERRLRADDDEIGVEGACEVEQTLAVLGADWVAAAERGDAGIARSCVQLLEIRGLAQLPGERMLASAGADQEHLHALTVASRLDKV